MAYALGLVVVFIFFGVMHFFTELNAKQKLMATSFVALFVVSAMAYNFLQANAREHLNSIVLQFKQAKSVQCQGVDVNSSNFTLSLGTYVFIGKKGSERAGQMLPASECE